MSIIHEVATMTSKGQITLPKTIRQALGIDVGSKVTFELHEDGQIIISLPTPSMKIRRSVRFSTCSPAISGPAGTFGRFRKIWHGTCSNMPGVKWDRTRISTATSTSDAAARMDAAVPRLPHRPAAQGPPRSPTRATKRSGGIRIQCECQTVSRAEPADAGSHPADSVPGRVPPGQYAGYALPPLAARQDRPTVPIVLPLRFQGEGHRLRVGQ